VTFEEWEMEKMVAEERRLLYVAATRAKDRSTWWTGEGVRLDPTGRAPGRDRRCDGGRGGPLPRHGAPGERLRLCEGAADGSAAGSCSACL